MLRLMLAAWRGLWSYFDTVHSLCLQDIIYNVSNLASAVRVDASTRSKDGWGKAKMTVAILLSFFGSEIIW
jgi:hypothetical protein